MFDLVTWSPQNHLKHLRVKICFTIRDEHSFWNFKNSNFSCEIKYFLDIFGFPIHRGIHQNFVKTHPENHWEGRSKMEFPRPAPISQLEVHLWFTFSHYFLSLKWPQIVWYGLSKCAGTFLGAKGQKMGQMVAKCHLAVLHRPNFFLFLARSGRPDLTLPVDR